MSDKHSQHSDQALIEEAKPRLQKPRMYKVILLNDDYTPMEFVVVILERFFYKNRDQATQIMLHVHTRGVGVCGLYTKDIAETKVKEVLNFANENKHPLQCTLEPD